MLGHRESSRPTKDGYTLGKIKVFVFLKIFTNIIKAGCSAGCLEILDFCDPSFRI